MLFISFHCIRSFSYLSFHTLIRIIFTLPYVFSLPQNFLCFTSFHCLYTFHFISLPLYLSLHFIAFISFTSFHCLYTFTLPIILTFICSGVISYANICSSAYIFWFLVEVSIVNPFVLHQYLTPNDQLLVGTRRPQLRRSVNFTSSWHNTMKHYINFIMQTHNLKL